MGLFPEGLAVAMGGCEPDYGFWATTGGRAVVLGRAVADDRGEDVVRGLREVDRPDPLDTTAGSRAYAEALAAHLQEHGEDRVGVDLLVMHTEDGGMGGWCIGSAGVWTVGKENKRCTPDRTVGAQLRALGVAVDDERSTLSTTRILAKGVEGGDVWYGAGSRFVAIVGWPLPDLSETFPAELSGDPAEVLGNLVRLVHRRCALQRGLVAIWDV